ncbi:MAG: serine/threonine-protein kinase [Kofleriaceae bacterium]
MPYHVGRELGAGALGLVVELVDDQGRVWAGKLLHESQQGDARARRRFEVEAKLLAGIHHPNLIEIEGLTHVDGRAALLMELVAGPDLAHLIAAEAPLPADRVIALGSGIAAGLAVAHRAGLVHRDLKPANILLAADGTPKIGDFGLARATSFAASDPDAVAVAGTPDYMAPESIDPLAIDPRSDLYALGCILCELATGAPPYRGATALAVIAAHRDAPLPALADVPDGLRRVIRWLLAKSPAHRPQSASEVEAALTSLASSTALVPVGAAHGVEVRLCARCGAAGPARVRVCFACGQPQLELVEGPMTVFVTGPGDIADKLDATLRQRLLVWIAANSALGLDARRLAKEVPRLPFTIVTAIDEAAAAALVEAFAGLGVTATAVRGGRFSLPAMRAKGWRLVKRVALIGGGSCFYMFHSAWALVFVGGVGVAAAAVWRGFGVAARPVTKLAVRPAARLPSPLDAALARVAAVVPAMTAARHRDALRGIIERVLALRDAISGDDRVALEPELAQLIDVAALASSRLDQLEAELSPEDLRSDDETARARWLARDRWAAKILQVTAFLDAMRARAVMAQARTAAQVDLDELRAQIEALEEVS